MFPLRLSLVLATIVFSTAAISFAASPYKEGDDVEVFTLGKWWPAKVVAVNARGQVLAEYEFAGGPHRQAFAPGDVHFTYEVGALAASRTYSDASGSFKIKAALLRVTTDTVTLRKPDMKEIDVPLAKLSPGDQAFIRSIAKKLGDAATAGAAPIRWTEPPPLETFAAGINTFGALSSATGKPIALDPDVAPAYLKMKQGGVGFANQDFFDRIGAVLPLGGSEGWILGVVANNSPGEKKTGTRLLWVSLAKQKIGQQQLLPPGEMVLDYHPGQKLLLTQQGSGRAGEEGASLTLWGASPVEKDLKPIVRWRIESNWYDDPWARIINNKIVLQRTGKQNYIGWNIETKRQDFKVAQESFFGAHPILSAGRRYFILPEDERVRVLDASNGQTLSTLPVKDRASAVAMTEDGLRLAVLERYSLRIWNFDNLEGTEERYPAESIGTPFSTKLAWVGSDRLMTDDGHGSLVLYSLKRRMSIWNYQLDHDARPEHGATRTHEIVAGHLVYAASVRSGGESGLAVGAVELPGPKVNETDAAVDPDSLLILKPGGVVKLEVNCGEYNTQVQEALEAEIKKNGWTINDAATAVISATMSQAEAQTITYRTGGFGQPVSEQTVTVTPYVSSLVLKMGDKEVWSSGTRTGAPGIISAKEGQSLQEEVDRWQKPNPGFFSTADIPDKIMDPAKRSGLGVTSVTNRGLIPK